jgi:hypothetical protein
VQRVSPFHIITKLDFKFIVPPTDAVCVMPGLGPKKKATLLARTADAKKKVLLSKNLRLPPLHLPLHIPVYVDPPMMTTLSYLLPPPVLDPAVMSILFHPLPTGLPHLLHPIPLAI